MRLLMFVILLLGLTTAARADELRPGYLEFTQRTANEWTLIWKAPLKGGVTRFTQPRLPTNCRPVGEPAREMMPTALLSSFTVHCDGNVAGQWIGLTRFGASQTDVLVRVAPLGRPVQAMRLTAQRPQAQIQSKPDRWQVASTYFVTGVDHILTGYDHLLFVLALVLLLGIGWPVVRAVTAFTLAHSLTLVGTTLGLIGLPQQPVEIVIALSIVFLAVEIVKRDPEKPRLSQRIPWLVAFLFGLLHGFGFAGALREIGLPESDVPTALLTFNLGVEAGQLAIVLATLALLVLIDRLLPRWQTTLVAVAAYGIGSIAAWWMFDRLFV